ncbi:MAG TPA: pseudaminic acid synthase [Candidatus Limnocylindrales bacterium]|nr:pseudaminic acid synthase [Candidatus Limnocylindrales bacterium]
MPPFAIAGRAIGPNRPVYVIAELSSNHGGRYEAAEQLVRGAKAAGADAVKLQTYTADTITIESDGPDFQAGDASLWSGTTLHQLYATAFMPWEWQPRLKAVADEIGIDLFSSPFDPTAVEFLERMAVPAYKVASFELVDLPLIRAMARTGKPLVMSTGMASEAEIDEAVAVARDAGAIEIALLKCTSAYPAPPESLSLRAIPEMARRWGLPVGLSDHTTGVAVAAAAVALGACLIEKHVTLSHADATPDEAFSLDLDEFATMVRAVREVEAAILGATVGPTEAEAESRRFRRSLFVVEDVAAGEPLTERNVRSIRPATGLHTREYEHVLGRRAKSAIPRGTPLSWELLEPGTRS